MTRFKVSLAVLFFILLLSIGSTIGVRWAGNHVLKEVQTLAASVPTLEQCNAIETAWEKAEPWLFLAVRRDKVITTSNSIYRLRPLLEADCDEFTAEVTSLQSNLEFLIHEDGFSFQMLF